MYGCDRLPGPNRPVTPRDMPASTPAYACFRSLGIYFFDITEREQSYKRKIT